MQHCFCSGQRVGDQSQDYPNPAGFLGAVYCLQSIIMFAFEVVFIGFGMYTTLVSIV